MSSARGQHYFRTVEISLENARNLVENMQRPLFLVSSSRDRLKKIFSRPFLPEKKFWRRFFWDRLKKNFENLFFWRTLASVSLVLGLHLERVCSWPRNFFVSLALASSLVSSTPPLPRSLVENYCYTVWRVARNLQRGDCFGRKN